MTPARGRSPTGGGAGRAGRHGHLFLAGSARARARSTRTGTCLTCGSGWAGRSRTRGRPGAGRLVPPVRGGALPGVVRRPAARAPRAVPGRGVAPGADVRGAAGDLASSIVTCWTWPLWSAALLPTWPKSRTFGHPARRRRLALARRALGGVGDRVTPTSLETMEWSLEHHAAGVVTACCRPGSGSTVRSGPRWTAVASAWEDPESHVRDALAAGPMEWPVVSLRSGGARSSTTAARRRHRANRCVPIAAARRGQPLLLVNRARHRPGPAPQPRGNPLAACRDCPLDWGLCWGDRAACATWPGRSLAEARLGGLHRYRTARPAHRARARTGPVPRRRSPGRCAAVTVISAWGLHGDVALWGCRLGRRPGAPGGRRADAAQAEPTRSGGAGVHPVPAARQGPGPGWKPAGVVHLSPTRLAAPGVVRLTVAAGTAAGVRRGRAGRAGRAGWLALRPGLDGCAAWSRSGASLPAAAARVRGVGATVRAVPGVPAVDVFLGPARGYLTSSASISRMWPWSWVGLPAAAFAQPAAHGPGPPAVEAGQRAVVAELEVTVLDPGAADRCWWPRRAGCSAGQLGGQPDPWRKFSPTSLVREAGPWFIRGRAGPSFDRTRRSLLVIMWEHRLRPDAARSGGQWSN